MICHIHKLTVLKQRLGGAIKANPGRSREQPGAGPDLLLPGSAQVCTGTHAASGTLGACAEFLLVDMAVLRVCLQPGGARRAGRLLLRCCSWGLDLSGCTRQAC